MIAVFIINILLMFMVSMALTVITMEIIKPTKLWLWHPFSIIYFLILYMAFI